MHVVGHRCPERGGREASLPERVDEDADDARRAFVRRGGQAGPVGQFLVRRRTGNTHGSGVRHVSEQSAENDDQLGPHLLHDGHHRLAEAPPAKLRFDAAQEQGLQPEKPSMYLPVEGQTGMWVLLITTVVLVVAGMVVFARHEYREAAI